MSGQEEARVALVTGGARGLGRAMVTGLLAAGYRVAATDKYCPGLQELASLQEAGGGRERLLTVEADLSLPGSEQEVVGQVDAAFGRVDILINNAGIGQAVVWKDNWVRPIKVWEIEPDQWQAFFNINTHAGFRLMRLLAPRMMAQGWGRIVNVTTSLATMLRPGFAPYGPSKAAAEALTSAIAGDLKGTGVTANVLVPGGLTNTSIVPENVPYNRSEMLQPEIMVRPLLWLVSDDASDCTGRRIVAARWNDSLTGRAAAELAGAPVGWSTAGSESIRPQRKG